MPVFQSADELYEIYDEFFKLVKGSEEAKSIMRSYMKSDAHNALVQYIYHKPEAKMTWMESDDGGIDVVFGETDLNPELIFEMDADIGHKFWLGEIELTPALARKQIESKGPLSKALKVVPQLKIWYPKYREYLLNTGRNELVIG